MTVVRDPQLHLSNPYSVEEEGELVDGKFQESEFINEEFNHEDVEDPSQGFVDQDSPLTYDDDLSDDDEDPKERSMPTDLEGEYK